MTERPPFPRPVELPDPDEAPGTSADKPADLDDPATFDADPIDQALDGEEPSGIADGKDYQIHPGWKTVRRVGSLIFHTIFWGVLFIAMILVSFFGDPPQNSKMIAFTAWFLLASLFILRAILWPSIAYKYISYRVTDRLFRFRRGVLWRSVISVPRSRVQHTDVSQGPLQRSFGLATLIVHTAGTENASVSLGGLPHDKALMIRDHLIGESEDGEGDAV